MPKEHKKRGRRAEQKKRKHDDVDVEEESPDTKRLRPSAADEAENTSLQQDSQRRHDDTVQGVGRPPDMPFYGLLDEEEQEYFKRADDMLELNQFVDAEDRRLFLENVWKEANGKELKLANSQSCSRLMERLILLSTPAQLKLLFQKFNGQFLHLVQHRFASHCCETLFLQSAPTVSAELDFSIIADSDDPNEVFVSMENLFLYTLNELEGNWGYLMTDRFASHALRVLLLVLSGEPMPRSSDRSLLRSKKKDKIHIGLSSDCTESSEAKRQVPQSFSAALENLIQNTISGLDTTVLRTLATHPTGNPTLQLLLKLELLHYGKQHARNETSIVHKLLPDDPVTVDSDSGSFINGLLFDIIGSRLLETIVQHAPSKLFKNIYKDFFKNRLSSLARNEIAGYVVSRVLERLSKNDLEECAALLVPQLETLVERNRTAVIKTLIERCAFRGVETSSIASGLENAYSGPNGFDIARLLKLGEAMPEQAPPDVTNGSQQAQPDKYHSSLLAQAMIAADGALGQLIFESILRLAAPLSVQVAKDPYASRTIQAALTSPHASIIFRRKVIQQFYGHIGELALDPSGSRVIDTIWQGTVGLAFIRERIAEELAENEASLRESFVGRAVWRNWRMDLYKRKRAQWVLQSRDNAGNEGFVPFPEGEIKGKKSGVGKEKGKTKLELAREKHLQAKLKKHKEQLKKEVNREMHVGKEKGKV